ncbi:hypothetical protein AtubIFM57258_003073 [Aspergillus tubingensis]|nr:hypothetical protein AtubIFM57258_003073 [Aspergillus tubingensis]
MLCLNVPAQYEKPWDIICRRLFWMLVAISGPEFVLTYASAQWGRARDSVRSFKASGFPQWTMRHGFFADMGGFHLVPPDGPPFPVTSKHIHWLVIHNYLPFPEITSEEITDRSKQDTVAKIVSCMQTSWMLLQCLGRAAQGLAITTLELSALAIVVCSVMTSLCWLHKPSDVRTPIRLELHISIEQIRREAGDHAMEPYKQTPLDFIDDLLPSWSLNVQPFMKMPVAPFERPLPRLGNDRLPDLKGYQEIILCIATLLYASIHLIGWNFGFPTKAELILWRVCSMFLFGNTVAFWVFETSAAWYRIGRWQRFFCRIFWKSKLEDVEQARLTRESAKVPKVLPLKAEFWSIFPLACTYAAARLYLIVEAFVGLRALEVSAYRTVDWTTFLPHL